LKLLLVGIIDGQSTKTTLVAGEARGFHAGKNVKGRKRHIIVDILGLILAVMI
jgi:putative transposase